MKRNKFLSHKLMIKLSALLVLSVAVTSLAGCQPLRKKFVRKKKAEKQDKFIPVLEPKDYPVTMYSVKERYSYHYSMWQVWEKELSQKLTDHSDKRLNYLVAQMLVQLNEMNKFLTGEKESELAKSVQNLKKIAKAIDRPPAMRRMSEISSKLRRHSREIREGFKPEYVQESIDADKYKETISE